MAKLSIWIIPRIYFKFWKIKKRLDKQILYHRQSFKNIYSNVLLNKLRMSCICLAAILIRCWHLKEPLLVRNDHEVFTAIDYANYYKKINIDIALDLKQNLPLIILGNKGLNLYYGTRWSHLQRHIDRLIRKISNSM